jgi:NTP pyrophosphatase (non-canonical NTP hydrolase)
MLNLPERPTTADLQRFIHDLEAHHGWLDVDLVHNVFLMVEEVGELAKAIRRYEKIFPEGKAPPTEDARKEVAHEIVDVLNYLLAIANRLDIDVESAFREKNAENLTRTWS